MSSVSPRRTVVGPAAQCRGVCCLRISSEGSPRTGIRCLLRARPRRAGVMTHRHPGPLEGPLLLMACPSPLASGRLEGRASRPRTQACLWRQPRRAPALVPTAGCRASRGNGPCRALPLLSRGCCRSLSCCVRRPWKPMQLMPVKEVSRYF